MNKRLHVTYVLPSLRVGGSEIQLLHLLRGLHGEFDVSVICTTMGGALMGDARRAGAHVRILEARNGWDFRMRKPLQRIFRGHKPDIVHTFLSGFDLFANEAARAAGVPVIISSRRELALWQKPRHLFMQRRANRLADCVVANSRAAAEYAVRREKLPADRIRVVYNGIDSDYYTSGYGQSYSRQRFRLALDGLVIGMVANFSPVKDHALFLDMADRLLKRHHNLHFLLAGTGPLVKKTERIIAKRKQSDFFTRIATISEMTDVYNAMDIVLLTSKVEGFPNALMEAMAAGRPVVAPAMGGIPELIRDGENGMLVRTRSAEAFAQAVESLIVNPAARKKCGEAAARHVREEFSLENLVRNYRDLYVELINEKREGGV
jgi:glycosyltransferase involved in cell wall biosynthesis